MKCVALGQIPACFMKQRLGYTWALLEIYKEISAEIRIRSYEEYSSVAKVAKVECLIWFDSSVDINGLNSQ
jgi:hypothetical protein